MITEYALEVLEKEISLLNSCISSHGKSSSWIKERESIRETVRIILEYNKTLVRQFDICEEKVW